MKRAEDAMKELAKPGSMCRRLLMGGVFFAFGLMFVRLGFWRTLLVAGLTVLGYAIGSSENLVESFKSIINKLFPPANKTVTYSADDIQKVQKALEKKDAKAVADEAKEEPKAEADKA